ncbi:FAD:protein FMN transferase [Aquimarina rhabdastrellae]
MKRLALLIIVIASLSIACNSKKASPQKQQSKKILNTLSGKAFGTTYSVLFAEEEEVSYQKSYDSLIAVINQSMSTYQKGTDITRINEGDTTVQVDNHFKKVFEASKMIYKQTQGAFDPTIGIIVNAWGFGPEGELEQIDSLKLKELMTTVGLDRVHLKNDHIIKENVKTRIDFNALAKGYAVDVFADFLKAKGYTDYLVEIGGEIVVSGTNTIKQKAWTVGIEDPNFDGTQSYSKIVELPDGAAMATSGSYRKFKIDKNGNRYAHIIDAQTGYPSKTNVLSVSVIAENCMLADAYATVFKNMGIMTVKAFLQQHPELKVYFIYENDQKELETLALNGFPE